MKITMVGPCSAETEEQVMETARAFKGSPVIFRAGIWKPRTMPNSFEGVGAIGLQWLNRVQEELGIPCAVEVADPAQVQACLNWNIKHLWIGARTAANPFAVQSIANTLRVLGAAETVMVYVKNPINPDLELWAGAVERLKNSGVKSLHLIHRGFSTGAKHKYRNAPMWNIAFDMMMRYPEYPMIGDCSHIAGEASLIEEVYKSFVEFDYNGVMVEVHPEPSKAWTDAAQQITPVRLKEIVVNTTAGIPEMIGNRLVELTHVREDINDIDAQIIRLLAHRLDLAKRVGRIKKANGLKSFDAARFKEVNDNLALTAKKYDIDPEYVKSLFRYIHEYSVLNQ